MSRRNTRLEDLAKLAGVSISTASRALNDSPAVNARTKQLIWKLAREHDYPFRRYMPAGPIGADGVIALVTPRPQGREGRLSDPFFLELLAGVGEAARERGCDVIMSHFAPTSYDDLSAAMNTSRADGVIFLGDLDPPEAMQRHRGYLDALGKAGLAVDPDLIMEAHFEVESAEASVDSLIRRGVSFDGVVCASDQIALGAVRALLHAGLRVPEDVSVIGFDNVPFSRYARPALTTIAQDTMKAGRLLVSKLLDNPGDSVGRSERIPTDLIVRESCGG